MAISHKTASKAFSRMKSYVLPFEICSERSNRRQFRNGSGNGLVAKRRQAITWTTSNPVQWRIKAAPGGGGGGGGGRVSQVFLLLEDQAPTEIPHSQTEFPLSIIQLVSCYNDNVRKNMFPVYNYN